MIKAKKFLGLIDKSNTSGLFKVECYSGKKWVVRLNINNTGTQRLISAFIAGKLANRIGLNHPKTELIQIPQNLLNEITNERIFNYSFKIGCANEFIDLNGAIDFDKIKNSSDDIVQIYGYELFLHWVMMNDWKFEDNIQRTQSGKIIFLDFDFAFSLGGWVINDFYGVVYLMDWKPLKDSVTYDPQNLNYWVNEINNISPNDFYNIMNSIPNEWRNQNGSEIIAQFNQLIHGNSRFIEMSQSHIQNYFL